MAELFTTNPKKLSDLLNDVEAGRIQLPDFQRGWVWDEERIQNLLVSIVQRFPIGAIMMLDAGKENAQFASVVLKNVPDREAAPTQLLLDGQQRLTSLYQALKYRGAVDTTNTKKKARRRHYYFNILEMIKPDFDEDEIVVIANEEKSARRTMAREAYDYSTTELECASHMFPANLVLDITAMNQWGQVYTKQFTDIENNIRWNTFFSKMIEVASYNIPVISLTQENRKEAVCSVFENVNTGGVPLNVFELLTATYAAEGTNLREEWEKEIEPFLKNSSTDYNAILAKVSNVDFLQAIALLVTHQRIGQAVACKRKHILDIKLSEYNANRDRIRDGFVEAARLLLQEDIYNASNLPYGSQLVPMAAIFAELGTKAAKAKSMQKILQWYWNGVFGELYGGANETRFVKDFTEMVAWIRGETDELPDTIKVASFRADRLDEMRTKNSAAYKGVSALILKQGAKDFAKGFTIDSIAKFNSAHIDIHHIFPKSYCEKTGIPREQYDSIINKAPISYDTNRMIGGDAPSIYITTRLDSDNGIEITDELLKSQLLEPSYARADDFNSYFAARKEALLGLIGSAMHKEL